VSVSPDGGVDLDRHLEDLRRKYMMEAMERVGGVQTKAAEMLGMTFRSFPVFTPKNTVSPRGKAQPPLWQVAKSDNSCQPKSRGCAPEGHLVPRSQVVPDEKSAY